MTRSLTIVIDGPRAVDAGEATQIAESLCERVAGHAWQAHFRDGGAPAQELGDVRPTDALIGRLDRLLSEFLLAAADASLDEADRRTLKHHAADLIGVGQAVLKRLGFAKAAP